MVTEGGDDLVNPYRHSTPGRFGRLVTGRGGVLRRRLVLVVAAVVSLALIGGTVGTSCAPPPAAVQTVPGGSPG